MLSLLNKVKEHLDAGKILLLVTALEGSRGGATSLFDAAGKHLTGQLLPLPERDGVHEIQGLTLFRETLRPAPALVICGGGHIAVPLARIAKLCDFKVTVIDDRPEFVSQERFPQADLLLAEDFDLALTKLGLGPQHYVVIITRGHVHDRLCLGKALESESAYIGMIGSKKKVLEVKLWLKEQGYSKAAQDRPFAPVGLEIGAETPAEIAVSIIAEVLRERSRQPSTPELTEVLAALAHKPASQTWALATIVKAEGSTPRGVGARMLVKEDGAIHGTVGGGIGEEEARLAALEVIKQRTPRLMDFTLTSTVAANQGMVCGGNFSVFIQPV